MDPTPIMNKFNDMLKFIKHKFDEVLLPKLQETSESISEVVKGIVGRFNHLGIGKELISYCLGAVFATAVVIVSAAASRKQKARFHAEKIEKMLKVDGFSQLYGLSCLATILTLAIVDISIVQPQRWSKKTKKGVRACILSAVLVLAVVSENKLSPSVKGPQGPSAMVMLYMAVAVAAVASARLTVRVFHLLTKT